MEKTKRKNLSRELKIALIVLSLVHEIEKTKTEFVKLCPEKNEIYDRFMSKGLEIIKCFWEGPKLINNQ